MILATANKHKLREMRELLPGLELEPLPEGVELPPEEGDSFAEIALEKARAAHVATGRAAVGDDSGIEVAGLGGGRPGIHSARYGGPGASDEENLAKLLREVAEAGEDRRAAYRCALALVDSGGERVFEGRCEGRLVGEPRGEGGFGYDPAFVPEATGPADERTMSELSQAEKNEISHRGAAARLLAGHLAAGGVAPGGR